MSYQFEKKTLILMSKSKKNRCYCVAGFDVENQEWCRLISCNKTTDYAIDPIDFRDKEGNEPELLSEITVDCVKVEKDPIQTENYLLNSSEPIIINHDRENSWQKLKESPKLFRNPGPFIYGNTCRYLIASEIDQFDYSLIFVKVDDFSVYRDIKYKCCFNYNGRHYKDISYTCHGLPKIGETFPMALILVSIPHTECCGKYYKFVSSCILNEDGMTKIFS